MLKLMAGMQSQLQAGRKAAPYDAAGERDRLAAALDRATSDGLARAVGLQFWTSGQQLFIYLTLPKEPPLLRTVAVDSNELDKLITTFSTQLMFKADPQLVRQSAQRLHALLIEPVRDLLVKFNARTLMISAADKLREVPFAALHDGKDYLVKSYAISAFSEAVSKLEQAPPRSWRVAGLGLTEAVEGLPALPGVEREVKAAVGAVGSGASWFDRDFDLLKLRSVQQSDFNLLHLASHWKMTPGRPELSWLYLGDQTKLTLQQLSQQRFDSFDLVTLAACQTGVGGGLDASGREMESLAAAVQKNGASAVLASLWNVADASSAELMQQFYTGRARKHLNKAEALRQAQLAVLESPKWQHPYYWAPFVIAGNWR